MRDVAENWHFAAALFLLIVLAASWLPAMFGVYGNWAKFMSTVAPSLYEQMPAISISEGVVTANPAGPTYVTFGAKDKTFAIIDTTGTVESLEHSDAQLLLTATQLIVKRSPAETRTYDLSRIRAFSIDRQKLQGWLQLAATWAPPCLFVFLVVLSWLYRLVLALVLGAAGLWMAHRANITIRYWAAVRLSIMSLYPTIILKTALEISHLTFPFQWLPLLGTALAYLWFGIAACRSKESVVAGSEA